MNEIIKAIAEGSIYIIGYTVSGLTQIHATKAMKKYREKRGKTLKTTDKALILATSSLAGVITSTAASQALDSLSDIQDCPLPQTEHDLLIVLTDQDGNVLQYTSDGYDDGEVISTDNADAYVALVEDMAYRQTSDYWHVFDENSNDTETSNYEY